MTKTLLTLFSAILLFSCNKQSEDRGYTLTGSVKNVPDNTMVMMTRNNIDIDSAMVLNGKFSFSGKVEEPISVFIVIPEMREFTSVWLENTDISLTTESGRFEDRVITGSDIQKEDDLLQAKIKPVQQSRDSARANVRNLSGIERNSVNIFLDDLQKKEFRVIKEFMRENSNSVAGTFFIDLNKKIWGKEKTQELYALLSEERRESTDGKMISHYLKINKDPKVWDQYADFEMNNAAGEAIRLSEIKGKYTLLYFWAAGCSFCKQENPILVHNYERFKDHGFEILGVSTDNVRSTFLSSIQEHDLTWNNLMSPAGTNNDAVLIYGITATPRNYLIDENGTIIARNLRGDALTARLEELML